MKHEQLINIVRSLSEERLRKAYGLTDMLLVTDALAHKAWNLALCASLYPILQIVEICLRNSIHEAMSQHFSDAGWFNNTKILHEADINMVQRTIKNLESCHRASDTNHLVSELTFGFWTALMTKRYERKIWHPLIKNIFPYLPRKIRTRAHVFEHFKHIKRLRNRVFHHQRIWHFENLASQHQWIIDAIYWIEPSVIYFVRQVDNFKLAHNLGAEYYKNRIINLLDT